MAISYRKDTAGARFWSTDLETEGICSNIEDAGVAVYALDNTDPVAVEGADVRVWADSEEGEEVPNEESETVK